MSLPLSTVITDSHCFPLFVFSDLECDRRCECVDVYISWLLILLAAVHHDRPVGTILRHSISLEAQMGIGIARTLDTWQPSYLLQRYPFSTGFVSVHGKRPSADYAKLRKESLESESGHVVGTQLKKCLCSLPVWPIFGFVQSSNHSISCIEVDHLAVIFSRHKRACCQGSEQNFILKHLGQALSTRPDILPPVYCHELAKLQLNVCFIALSLAAHLRSGELVAVKVQRPGMLLLLTLDALLFHMIGGQLKRFAKARKDLLVAANEMVRHMFDESITSWRQEMLNALHLFMVTILVAAILEQASESFEEPKKMVRRKSFDMHAVVAATEDFLLFILSEKGLMVRVFILRDIVRAADIFLQDEVLGCRLDAERSCNHDKSCQWVSLAPPAAVKLAPEVWTAMFIRIALNPQTHSFSLDIISAVVMHLSNKFPESFCFCMSRLIHK
ncbi:hypothetical protein REPUB_Repub18cG0169900 [Reevesia pubescens]